MTPTTCAPERVRSVPAAAGRSVRDRLSGPPREVPVLHRGRDAVYVEESGWALGVVSARASRVPCALVLAAAADVDLAAVTSAQVGDGTLVLHGRTTVAVSIGRLTDASVPRITVPDRAITDLLLARARPATDELGPELLASVASAPERLIGLGSGLTPLGDDVLSGWAATSYALGAAVDGPDPRGRTTLLSATLLDCARRGEVLPELRDLLLALHSPDRVDDRAASLAAVGHTSGAGLLLGCALRLAAPALNGAAG